MAALTALSAGAATPARPTQIKAETAPRTAGEPIMAIVSISTQKVTYYDADGWIYRAPVSTGVKGRETPAGVFALIEKDKDHHSTMYDDAWMPNMQRITWNGIALHGGPLPGYAASHGCVRMPYDFAEKLFDKTHIGMRVIIAPNDPAPVAFSHPALFMPKAEAIAAAPARAETLAHEAAEAVKAAAEAKKAAVTTARETKSLAASLRKLEAAQAERRRRARLRRQSARQGARFSEDGRSQGAGRGAQAKGRRQGRRTGDASSTRQKPTRKPKSTPPLPQRTPPRRPTPRRPQPSRRPPRPSSRSSRSRSTSAAPRRSFTCGATRTSHGRTAARCSMRASRSRSRSAIPTGRSARISSRRWRATALRLRWTAVTIDEGDNAKDALDRITIPQDVLASLAPTAAPRSSIIVSDEPLSKETNYRTEFVAVLSNQPQGGFITRKVTPPDDRIANGGGDDSFSFFGRSWNGNTPWRNDYRPVPRGWWR